jgi:hypothetical protein
MKLVFDKLSYLFVPVKMTFFGNLFHLIMGTLFCSVPITYMCALVLN